MARFATGLLLGLVAGAAAGAGGATVLLGRAPAVAPPAPSGPAPDTRKTRRSRHSPRGDERSIAPSPSNDDPPIALGAADRQMASEGDALRAAATSLDLSPGGAEPRDLGQDEIDAAIARRGPAIVRCITEARGDAPLTGRVTAGVVVAADGHVLASRIEAPAWLLRHGLGACARRELEALRFPATGKQTVVTVPFDIDE